MLYLSTPRPVYVSGYATLLVLAAACSDPSSGRDAGGNAGGDPAKGGSPASTTTGTVAKGGTSNKPSTSKGNASGGATGSRTSVVVGGTSSDEQENRGGSSNSTKNEPDSKGGTHATDSSSSRDSSGTPSSRGGTGGKRSTASGATSSASGGSNSSSAKTSSTGGASNTSSSNATGGNTATGNTQESTLVPDKSWDCGMPNGIVPPTLGELVLRAELQIGKTYAVGETQFGERRILDVKGGTLTGDRVNASFLTGGLDLELTLSNGNIELEQVAMLRASDGTLIVLRTCGVAQAGDGVVRIVPDFEAPNSSSLAWLNTGKFVGTRSTAKSGVVELAIYDVSKVSSGADRVQLTDPTGVPNQTWGCSTATGQKGASVFTETVGIGSSLSVGASKRGTRNVIPITGGSMSGRVAGSVLAGGADFQLTSSGPTVLDARYTLSAKDGEFILVRNCGPMGAMVPTFEARADGPYAFLNANTFVSSDPGMATGGVSITFYERK